MSNESVPTDCLGCRLVSGFGITGIGAYFAYHSRQFIGFNRLGLMGLATGN